MRSVNIYGKHFNVGDEPADFWGWVNAGAWEPETFRILDTFLTPHTLYLDLGAWVGPTALYASQIVGERNVRAFEPDPVAFAALSRNFALNGMRPQLDPRAVMGYDGAVTIGSTVLGCSTTRVNAAHSVRDMEVIEVTAKAARLSTLYPDGWTRPMFIKMDVEGAEVSICEDLDFFSRCKPDVYISLHRDWFLDRTKGMEAIRKVGRLYRYTYGTSWMTGKLKPISIESEFDLIVFSDRCL